jgi:hypothetical protein
LLSNLLFEADVPNVSEPDFYTQLSGLGTGKFNILKSLIWAAARNLSTDLLAAFP